MAAAVAPALAARRARAVRVTRRRRARCGVRRRRGSRRCSATRSGRRTRVSRGTGGAPTLAIVGHIDEIGLAITHVEESGLLLFRGVGGSAPRCSRTARRDPDARRRSAASSSARGSGCARAGAARTEHLDLPVDIGARDGGRRERLVRDGDAGGGRGRAAWSCRTGGAASRAIDNRLGAYIALEAARRVAEAGARRSTSSRSRRCRRRSATHGARVGAFSLEPAIAIAIDVTQRRTCPAATRSRRASTSSGRAGDLARPDDEPAGLRPARRGGRGGGDPDTIEVSRRDDTTDMDEIHLARAGIPTGLVSVPLRYMHSPSEIVALATSRRACASSSRSRAASSDESTSLRSHARCVAGA